MTAWTAAPAGGGRLDMKLPDGSVVRYHPGFLFTRTRLTHAGAGYRLVGWDVWRGDEHLLSVRPAGYGESFRGLRDTVAALWRAARSGRYDRPLPPTEVGRATAVGSGGEYVLQRQNRTFSAVAADGRAAVAVTVGLLGPPYEVRAAGPDLALLLAVTHLALTHDN